MNILNIFLLPYRAFLFLRIIESNSDHYQRLLYRHTQTVIDGGVVADVDEVLIVLSDCNVRRRSDNLVFSG